MGFVREVPFCPINGEKVDLETFKNVVSDHQIVKCDKVSVLKAKRKNLVGSYYKEIADWLIAHPDSFEIVRDFRGYDFGVEIEERLGRVYFRNPLIFDKEYYKDYNTAKFNSMGIADKLEFIKNGCNYVPVVIIEEKFYVDNHSHMWSHIKNNKELMSDLDVFLKTSRFAPHFSIFYFIRYDSSRDMVYLKRDYMESPREELKEVRNGSVDVELPEQISGVVIVKKKKEEQEESETPVESVTSDEGVTEEEAPEKKVSSYEFSATGDSNGDDSQVESDTNSEQESQVYLVNDEQEVKERVVGDGEYS